MERRIKPWVNKKIVEYIGEPEPTLVEFICSKVLIGSQPQSIINDVQMVFFFSCYLILFSIIKFLILPIRFWMKKLRCLWLKCGASWSMSLKLRSWVSWSETERVFQLYLVSILQLKLFYQDPIEYVQLITPLTQKEKKMVYIAHISCNFERKGNTTWAGCICFRILQYPKSSSN